MITPGEAVALDPAVRIKRQIEASIDTAIRTAASTDRWPCEVSIEPKWDQHIESVRFSLLCHGWRTSVVRRPGFLARLVVERPEVGW